MKRCVNRVGAVVGLLMVAQAALAKEPAPNEARLREHVSVLASRAFQGRSGEGGKKAGDYILSHFKALKLEPLFGDAYVQSIPGQGGEGIIGRNVGAVLRGSDPKLRDEWVIVSAHFDHLGARGEVFYPGADDNASGVAMMLETARAFANAPKKPRRSLMFIGFDLEEVGLFGSRYFVEHPPVPLTSIGLFLTADMIGRSLGGVCKPYVFVMGTENAPALRPWVEDAAKGGPVKVGLLGSDLLILNRSDYGPFRAKKVPYLFFSTGENPTYHTPNDTPDTLDYPKLTAISGIIGQVVSKAVNAETLPAWTTSSAPSLAEATALRDVLRTLLQHREELKVGGATALLMGNTLRSLDAIIERGAITPQERTGVIRVAQIVMMSIF